MSEDEDRIIGEFTYVQGIVLALVAGAIFFAFAYFGSTGRARTALVSSTVILATIKIFWPLRRHSWFWLTMTCIAVAHATAIAWLPLSGDYFSGVRIAQLTLLDIFVAGLIVYSIAKLKGLQ